MSTTTLEKTSRICAADLVDKIADANVAGVCEILWSLESQFDLLNHETAGIYPWALRRMAIYYRLCYALGIFQDEGKKAIPKASVTYNVRYPLLELNRHRARYGRPDYLIVPSGRYNTEVGTLACPYTLPWIQNALSAGMRVAVLSNYPLGFNHPLCSLLPAQLLSGWMQQRADSTVAGGGRIKQSAVPDLSQTEVNFWRNVQTELNRRLSARFDLFRQVKTALAQHRRQAMVYSKLVRILAPELLMVVCHYGRGVLIEAAQHLRIPVTEMQHGTISRYHLGYSYPNWRGGDPPIPYFPDSFISWGEYWTKKTPLPLPRERVLTQGFAQFRQIHASIMQDPPRRFNNQVLILSQTVLAAQVINWVARLGAIHQQYHFVLNCHPNEDVEKAKHGLQHLQNVTVVEKTDLYLLMAQSNWVIGVFSTAIYEAIAFGARPVLIALPGIGYMEDLIKNYGVPILTHESQFLDCLEKSQPLPLPVAELF